MKLRCRVFLLLSFAPFIGALPAYADSNRQVNQLPFTDIGSSWATDTIIQMHQQGYINGYPDRTFHPQANIGRDEFAKLLTNVLHQPGDAAETFADTQDSWARAPIGALKHLGIVNGFEGRYSPSQSITRAEVAIILQKMLSLSPGNGNDFSDIQSSYAKGAIEAVYTAGIMHGDSPLPGKTDYLFRPNDPITRAEAATVMYNLLPKIPASLLYNGSIQVLAFTENQNDLTVYQTVYQHLDSVATFTYGMTSTGSLTGSAPTDMISAAQSDHVTPLVLVHNYTSDGKFDPKLASTVLQSPATRQTLETNILSVIEQSHYAGVNLDFELLPPSSKGDLIAFLTELHQLLAPKGLRITIDVPAITSSWDTWDAAYDYQTIGNLCDQVIIMAYDYSYPGSIPGPISPIVWTDQVLQYAVARIPASKIWLGIPGYGYNFVSNSPYATTAVTEHEMPQLIADNGGTVRYDLDSDENNYTYSDAAGFSHVVWYETPDQTGNRIDLAKTYHVAGVALWRLGQTDSDFWNAAAARIGH